VIRLGFISKVSPLPQPGVLRPAPSC